MPTAQKPRTWPQPASCPAYLEFSSDQNLFKGRRWDRRCRAGRVRWHHCLYYRCYDRLIGLIWAVGPELWGHYRRDGLPGVIKAADLNFSLPLLAGIGAGILLVSKSVLLALEYYPAPIWSVFLGLVLAAVPMVLRGLLKSHWIWLAMGCGRLQVLVGFPGAPDRALGHHAGRVYCIIGDDFARYFVVFSAVVVWLV